MSQDKGPGLVDQAKGAVESLAEKIVHAPGAISETVKETVSSGVRPSSNLIASAGAPARSLRGHHRPSPGGRELPSVYNRVECWPWGIVSM